MTVGTDVVESSVINEVLTEIYLNKPGEVFEDWNEVFRVHAVRAGQFERLQSLTSVLQHILQYFLILFMKIFQPTWRKAMA